eukprot:3046570-Prymnesium_polylepis.2
MPPGSCSLYTYPRCALDGDLEHRPLKGNRLALLNEMLLQLFANDEFAAETDAVSYTHLRAHETLMNL